MDRYLWRISTIIVATIVTFALIMLFAFSVRFSDKGEGHHSGYITAIDQKGYIFRNYVVYFKTENSSSQEDVYCIDRSDTALIEQAKKANQDRKAVTLEYRGVRGIGVGLCNGEQIYSIK